MGLGGGLEQALKYDIDGQALAISRYERVVYSCRTAMPGKQPAICRIYAGTESLRR